MLSLWMAMTLLASTCDEQTSMEGLANLARSLPGKNTFAEEMQAGAMIEIAKSCDSGLVKTYAAILLKKVISPEPRPTLTVANASRNLCGKDAQCNLELVRSLSFGFGSNDYTIIELLPILEGIASESPTPEILQAISKVLSKCFSRHRGSWAIEACSAASARILQLKH